MKLNKKCFSFFVFVSILFFSTEMMAQNNPEKENAALIKKMSVDGDVKSLVASQEAYFSAFKASIKKSKLTLEQFKALYANGNKDVNGLSKKLNSPELTAAANKFIENSNKISKRYPALKDIKCPTCGDKNSPTIMGDAGDIESLYQESVSENKTITYTCRNTCLKCWAHVTYAGCILSKGIPRNTTPWELVKRYAMLGLGAKKCLDAYCNAK
jgi:hypothetical protein